MIDIHPKYIFDEKNQKKAVVLQFSEWEQVLDELEELDDIRCYDQAKKNPSETVSFEDFVRKFKSDKTI